jgi:hypothetical protein
VTYTLPREIMFPEAAPVVLRYNGTQWLAASQQPHTDAAALPNPTAADLTCSDADVPHCAYVPPSNRHDKNTLCGNYKCNKIMVLTPSSLRLSCT